MVISKFVEEILSKPFSVFIKILLSIGRLLLEEIILPTVSNPDFKFSWVQITFI